MRRRRPLLPLLFAAAIVSPLFGCASFGLGDTAPAPTATPAARALDVRSDPLPGLIFAFDLPADIQPRVAESTARLDFGAGRTARHVTAQLALADGDSIDGTLPPPATGHTYYLLGFSSRDRASLVAAQKAAAALPPDAPANLTLAPKFCRTGEADLSQPFAVQLALPGGPALAPLIPPERLAAVTTGKLPACTAG